MQPEDYNNPEYPDDQGNPELEKEEFARLLNRIKTQLRAGKPHNEIVNTLANEGWDKDAVTDLVDEVCQTYDFAPPAVEKKRGESRSLLGFLGIACCVIAFAIWKFIPDVFDYRDGRFVPVLLSAAGIILIREWWRRWARSR